MSTLSTNLAGWSGMAATGPKASEREKLAGAAKQFEAIFVRQMLAAARKTDFGGEDLFGNSAIDTFREMQDSQIADIAASTGKFGLAKQIEAHLAKFVDTPSTKPGADVLNHAEADSAAKS